MIDYLKLREKIEKETVNKREAKNYADSLFNAPIELANIVEFWLDGQELDFEYTGITLFAIQEKEKCSYFRALLRMQILMTNKTLADGYMKWTPSNKDWNK